MSKSSIKNLSQELFYLTPRYKLKSKNDKRFFVKLYFTSFKGTPVFGVKYVNLKVISEGLGHNYIQIYGLIRMY